MTSFWHKHHSLWTYYFQHFFIHQMLVVMLPGVLIAIFFVFTIYVMVILPNQEPEVLILLVLCSRCSMFKIACSNPSGWSTRPNDPTSLRSSWWPPGKKLTKTQLLILVQWYCPLDSGPKLVVEQPNSRFKKILCMLLYSRVDDFLSFLTIIPIYSWIM